MLPALVTGIATRPNLVALPAPAPRTAARQALAVAVRAMAGVTNRLEQAVIAVDRAKTREADAIAALQGAQAAFEAAKASAAAHLAASLADGADSRLDDTVAYGRSEMVGADDDLQIATAARHKLEMHLAEIQAGAKTNWDIRQARDAAYRVIADEVSADLLVGRIERLQRDLFAASMALDMLLGKGIVESTERGLLALKLGHVPISQWPKHRPDVVSALGVREVVGALVTDADASMPLYLTNPES